MEAMEINSMNPFDDDDDDDDEKNTLTTTYYLNIV